MPRQDLWIVALMFIAVYTGHSRSTIINSTDSMWALHTAHSIAYEGNLNLTEFKTAVKAKRSYGVRRRRGHIYNYFPYGVSILAAPFVAFFDSVPSISHGIVPGLTRVRQEAANRKIAFNSLSAHLPLERAIASSITALASIFLFLCARFLLTPWRAALLAMCFAFGTSAWSNASRGLWQHGPSMLMHCLSLYLLLRAERGKNSFCWAGLPVAFSFVVRPTNAVVILAFLGYMFFRHREKFLPFCAVTGAVAAPFVAINLHVFGKVIPSYYDPGRLSLGINFLNPLLANLISPSRGVFFLSPFLLFAFFAIPEVMRGARDRDLMLLCLAASVAHLLAVSIFPAWWGGHCFGARYMSDVVPFLCLLSIPAIRQLGRSAPVKTALFILCLTGSVIVHYIGANSPQVYAWNILPRNIDHEPNRVWHLSDPQFLRRR